MPTTTIIAIGDELAEGRIRDANSHFLARELLPTGATIRHILVVPDSLDHLVEILKSALEQSNLVLTTGGLGPTDLDLTREAVTLVTQRETVIDPVALETVRGVFRERGVTLIPEWAPRLARIPAGALALINPKGLATGFVLDFKGATLACLPGEPDQVRALWHEALKQDLARRFNLKNNILTHTLQVATGEPAIVKNLDPWLSGKIDPRVNISVRSRYGVVSVDFKVKADDLQERIAIMDNALVGIRKKLGDAVFGDNDDTLENALVALLIKEQMTISTAEASTGGAVSSAIINVPGVSQVFLEGIICYSNESKTSLLGVPSEFFRMYGSVSESVAMAMATGVRALADSDVGLAITGILGPGGGTNDKPVGLTWIACDVQGSITTSSMVLTGNRRTIKEWSTRSAINFARLSILRYSGAF
jgi:nicotinamide-nucleotide amidase